MKIQSMFQKDIDRPINGVVKVMQDDQQSLKDELSEYIITKELRRHFATFFDNYVKAIDTPTDKIGVWISGFFGSGKSHFLKMLSYLLSNKEVDGKHAFDYFADKFDDPMMYATVQKCVRIPTESILFNIDIEGPINKDKTAVLRVFAKVFYNHCGFYGEDLKVAKLERFIDKQGKTDAFRAAFKEVNGDEWVNARDSAAFFEDDVVEVLQSVLGMSETAARNWFNGEENADMSIKQLVSEIKEYVDSKEGNFRLLFCVDEVGQYIGDDGDLMMNLQSLVEEIGDKCRGKVWVMVTSQEAIDSVVKITGNDFSKIQGRFNTRLSLSSSSVDEVIKKRVLAKTEDADHLLQMEYEKEASGLKSLFAFDNPILDIKGFTSAAEFSATFPFVPYQFIVIQKVLAEIRKHGNSGKHLSGGERSMLSGFQEAAQKIENKDENALVPFYQFYDTVHTFLESAIRRVIDRCQNAADANDGLEQQDVNVLKLLYLVRYIEDVKANIENIAILMIDDIHTDKIALRASITASLERLLSQNYISRNGDTYAFLTDEEQDIAIDIKNTPVDSAQIVQSISQTVYCEIYPAKKYKYGKYDFALEMRRRVKEQLKKLGGMEFYDVNFSYIDNDTFEEHFVSVPEQGGGKLIPEGMCNPGQVYTVSQGKSGMIGVFRLESQMLPGSGKVERTGLNSDGKCKEAANTAFNYLKANGNRISGAISTTTKDYIINYQDLQGIGMTEKLALPTLIALCSIALGKPTLSSLAVLGEISIAGTMLKVDELANALQVCLDSGAKKVLLPITSAADLGLVPADLIGCFNLVFYQSAEDAVYKALGVE